MLSATYKMSILGSPISYVSDRGASGKMVTVLLGQAKTLVSNCTRASYHYCSDARCYSGTQGDANEDDERHSGSWQMFDRWVKGSSGELHGQGVFVGRYFHTLEETVFCGNKLLSKSWFSKLTLLDRGVKVFVKGTGSTLQRPLYKKGINRVSPRKEEDPFSV